MIVIDSTSCHTALTSAQSLIGLRIGFEPRRQALNNDQAKTISVSKSSVLLNNQSNLGRELEKDV
jgi:hypothetical protein